MIRMHMYFFVGLWFQDAVRRHVLRTIAVVHFNILPLGKLYRFKSFWQECLPSPHGPMNLRKHWSNILNVGSNGTEGFRPTIPLEFIWISSESVLNLWISSIVKSIAKAVLGQRLKSSGRPSSPPSSKSGALCCPCQLRWLAIKQGCPTLS